MSEELKEVGLDIGYRRVGRLMRQNGISVVRTRKHKFNIAPDLLDRDFLVKYPNQKWAADTPGRHGVRRRWQSSSTLMG